MGRWRWIVVVGLSLLAFPFSTGIALAQDSAQLNPLVWKILAQVSVIFDGILGHFVSGNALTGEGESLSSNLAWIFHNTSDLVAQLTSWLLGPVF